MKYVGAVAILALLAGNSNGSRLSQHSKGSSWEKDFV